MVAAAPAIPFPFRTVTRTCRRPRIGVVGAFGFAGAVTCLLAANLVYEFISLIALQRRASAA